MVRTTLIALLATVSFAQTAAPPPPPPKPPADVDRALRARIKAFYDLLLDHQFRKAEELVAPDYRDFYYERDKPRYTSYEVTGIEYSGGFTQADVALTVTMPPIHPMIPATAPGQVRCLWRLIDGLWYWSVPKLDPLAILRSLSGANPGAAGMGAPPSLPGGITLPPGLPAGMDNTIKVPSYPNLPPGLGKPEAITSMVPAGVGAPAFSLDRSEVTVKRSGTGTVTISNTSGAPMTLFLLGKLTGIDAAFDRPRIGPGEKAVLSIHAAAEATGGALVAGVLETNAMITITVTVK